MVSMAETAGMVCMNNDLTEALKGGKIPAIKKAVQDGRQPLLDSFRAGQVTGRAAAQGLSAIVDHQICVFAGHFLSEFRDRITLVMTGANGRNDICPRSDLDLLILVPDILPDGFAEAYSAFSLALTDSGFGAIGNCMRTPAECANLSLQDNPTWTSLTDRRRLWGAIPLYCALDRTMDRLLPENGDLLLGAKLDERSKRLGRMADAAYVLHPHIKECAGGLRDFQTVLWIARAAFGCKGMDCFIERDFSAPAKNSGSSRLTISC